MKHYFKVLVVGIISLLMANLSFAQVTTSSLGGQILDEKGQPVIGVAVIATHVPSGTTYGAVTNLDGRYTIAGMRTGGPYKVEMSNLGYRSITYTDITLKLGELFVLNAVMQEATEKLNEAVVIASPKSKFSAEKSGATTNISNKQLVNLPTVSRSISDVAKLSPYGGQGMNLASSDGRSANFTVDGANFNNNFGLSSALPGGGSPISLDAIEEMQVVISPYDVRQTNFIGGGVNAITKSGTNIFKATAYSYFRNEKFRGTKVAGVKLAKLEPEYTTTYGVTVGGPIIKNKLFFFANAEYIPTSSVSNRWRASKDGEAKPDEYISRTTEESLQKVADFLKQEYNYDPGSFTSFPSANKNIKALLRLDWNITDKHHLAFRYNFTKNQYTREVNGTSTLATRRVPNGFNRIGKYSMSFSNSMYSQHNDVQSFSLDFNSRFSNSLSNQLLATYSYISDYRVSPSANFPFVDILHDSKLEPYMAFGYELFSPNNRVDNNVFTIKDDLTYYAGNHKLTLGASFEYQNAANSFMRGGTGYYRYKSLDDFLNKRTPETVGLTYGYSSNAPKAEVAFSQLGLYIQDDWDITDKLKLNAGLRFDTILFRDKDLQTNNAIKALDYGGRHIDTGMWPKTNVQISPRLGLSWDVLGDKTLKIRGGTGLFAGRLPLVFFTNMPTNSAMLQNTVSITTDNKGNADPNLAQFAGNILVGDALRDKITSLKDKDGKVLYPATISPETGTVPYEVNGVANNFKMPQVWKTSIGVDYQFPTSFPLTISGEFIFNKTINGVLINNWNINQDKVGESKGDFGKRKEYSKDSYYHKQQAYVLENTNKGYSYTANLTLTAEPVKNLNLMASYTYSAAKEITGMPGNQAGSVYKGLMTIDGPNYAQPANSQYLIPHRLIASVSYSFLKINHISLFYEGQVGAVNSAGWWNPGSYVYGFDTNGDAISADLFYVPSTEQELDFIKDETQRTNLWNYIKNNPYLSSRKGRFAEAYVIFSPMVHRFDLRYAVDLIKFKAGENKHALQFSVDCMNIGNLFNSSWGVGYQMSKDINYGRLVDFDAKKNEYTSKVVPNAKTLDRYVNPSQAWFLQIGLKYMFN